jgi:hypothetical protein
MKSRVVCFLLAGVIAPVAMAEARQDLRLPVKEYRDIMKAYWAQIAVVSE